MKVKMLMCLAGTERVLNIGEEVELADTEAKRLIEAGIAEPVKVKREKATPPKSERATKE